MSIEHPSFGKLDDDRIIIFDTTLRDGEQSPGFSMNLTEKIRMAEALTELGIDVMEAGFPIASIGDYESVKAIAEASANVTTAPVICETGTFRPRGHAARCRRGEGGEAQAHPQLPSPPPVHMKYKLRMEPDEVLQAVSDSVTLARQLSAMIPFKRSFLRGADSTDGSIRPKARWSITIWPGRASSQSRDARFVTLPMTVYSRRCSKPICPSVA